MEFLEALQLGFSVSLSLENLYLCLIGVTLGTAVGVLPGLGPSTTVALLLPITFRMDPTGGLIMLAGIFYGAMYGGSITSILMRVPGEAASVITCIDGHMMAKKGRAGPALGMAAFGSFIAGIVATLGIAIVGPAASQVAFLFGPVEMAALVICGLAMVASVSPGSQLNALAMVGAGLLLSTVGADFVTGQDRFVFGRYDMSEGFNIALVAMGTFGISELLMMAERAKGQTGLLPQPRRLRELLPSLEDWKKSAFPIGRGTVLGFFLGLLPGAGALLASFASYAVEKKMSKRPEEFGEGAIEGVAGPEAANNSAAQASLVPLLGLGIPTNAIMGMLLGAMMIHGVVPGANLVNDKPDLFWGLITSMFIGNLLLVLLNVPLLGVFVALLRIPIHILSPLIMIFCVVGAFSLANKPIDVLLLCALGIGGYCLRKARYDPAPLVVAFVLGGILEKTVRQSLLLGYGSPYVFIQHPISATLLVIAAAMLLLPLLTRFMSASNPLKLLRNNTEVD